MASWNRTDPKPVKRVKATPDGWRQIHAHFRGQPLMCAGGIGYRPEDPSHCLHHIAFKRADSGDDLVENLVPLRSDDHVRLHARSRGWKEVAAAIRQYVMADTDRRHYAEVKLGERLNRRYPPLENTDPQFLEDRARLFARHAGEIE